VAIFTIDVDDELVPYQVPTNPGRQYFDNAAQSTRDGIELSLTLNPTDRLRAMVSYTYSDFEFDDFVDATGADFSGNVIPGIPDEVLFGELMYRNERGWYAALDVLHTGDQYADNGNLVLVDSYSLVNLRVGLDKELDRLTISPFIGINNVGDEFYYGNIRINADATISIPANRRYYEPAPGSNAYAGIGVSFRHR
jgi:iron complex outermembrane receptor protein